MKALQKLVASVALLAAGVSALSAQTRDVSGKVLDDQQQPVVGAAVFVPGTTNGTMTGADGEFTIKVPGGDVRLEVSCLGYETKVIEVRSAQAQVSVVLQPDTMLLDETVVVGYGTQKKVNLTGAISVVESKDLENRSAHTLTDMLQGQVPGLNITTSSGNPGSSGSLNIRGYTSINSADPIVVIDGAIGDMSRVNPNDVASISVIKDAAAAAIYGARAAFGVVLITTKSGSDTQGKAKVRYSGRIGWEEPTTSTDYETRGYWSVYTVDKFWATDAGQKYTTYTDADMAQLLARVNDKTENPERPWVVEEVRNGQKQWVYYCNTDWYHEMYKDQHPVQQHSVSITGGSKSVRYLLSGAYDRETGIIKSNPDVYSKYNMRSKIDFDINKYMKLSNNTSFYSGVYSYPGVGDVQDSFAYSSRHALASFPLKNPDGSWLYATPMIAGNYNVANGRHIVYGMGYDKNKERRSDFTNTTELTITPIEQLSIVANYTYRTYNYRNSYRQVNFEYRQRPDSDMEYYTTGAGLDQLQEQNITRNYYASNVYATYEDTFADAHHLKVMAGMNVEKWNSKNVTATGQNLAVQYLSDLALVQPDTEGNVLTSVAGGYNDYGLMGYFARINYDWKGRYLVELSGRADGTSRFASGSRWGFFPSASAGWRISEEPFFAPLRGTVDNLKLRASFGTLGNQIVRNGSSNVYYAYLREIEIKDFAAYSFGEGSTVAKYSTITDPVSSDLTWEKTQQYNIGLDADLFRSRLNFTAEAYVRNTLDMLTTGKDLPAVYGASSPKMNAADLSTRGYELSLSWRDHVNVAGHPLGYSVRGTLSDYRSYITKFDNPTKNISNYYKGYRIGSIWGYVVDGIFATDQEAADYTAQVDYSPLNLGRMTGGVLAGDLRFVDLDGDGKITTGAGTKDDPGDRKIIGNSLPSLQYGFTLSLDYMGFDLSAFFQGVGNHYWYPAGMNQQFWGTYSYSYVSFLQKDFIKRCWSEDNPDAYFPRPRAYSATGGELSKANTRYLQNIRYLRFKNFTFGYTLPENLTKRVGIEQLRVYFTGENLCYWSPFKKNCKYIDPESAFRRYSGSNARDHMSYPWQKTFLFGVDVTF